MPNWVKNKVQIKGKKGELEKIRETLKTDDSELSFSTILPMPNILDVESSNIVNDAKNIYESEVLGLTQDQIFNFNPTLKGLLEAALNKDYNNDEFKVQMRERAESLVEFKHDIHCADCKTPFEPVPKLNTIEDVYALGKIIHENAKLYSATTWYDWNIEQWGTKWDVCDAYCDGIRKDKASKEYILEYEFETAWSMPENFFIKFSQMFPTVEITVEFADEDIGSNCGTAIFVNGDISFELPDNPVDFALDLNGYDKKEWYAEMKENEEENEEEDEDEDADEDEDDEQ